MSRKVRKIPRALRREKPTRREGNPDAWLEQQMQAANLSSFVSSEPTHSKPRQLRRVEPKRRTRENFHDEYGGGGGDYRSAGREQPVQSQRSREPARKKQPTPQKKRVEVQEEEEDEDEGYSDEDFEDYGEDDFEDFEDEESDNKPGAGTASSKTAESRYANERKVEAKSGGSKGGTTLRFPKTSNNRSKDPGASSKTADFGSNQAEFSLSSTPKSKKKVALDLNPARDRRIRELKKQVNLVEDGNVLFSLAPLQPYDLYVRKLGSKNCKQASNMTNDDARTADTQTLEITNAEASAQVPDDLGYAGGGILNDGRQATALTDFLRRIMPVIETSLDENMEGKEASVPRSMGENVDNESAYSAGWAGFGCPGYLANRRLLGTCASLSSSTTVCSCHSPKSGTISSPGGAAEDREKLAGFNASLAGKGLVCVWQTDNSERPVKTLVCEGLPVCCAMSPVRPTVVVAGTSTGSIMVWDLREPNSVHEDEESRTLDVSNGLRRPSYSTDASALASDTKDRFENQHCAPIVGLVTLNEGAMGRRKGSFGGDSTSFQIASLDQSGVVMLWTVLDTRAKAGGSEADLGLGIGARVKLTRTARIPVASVSMESYAFDVFPNDTSHLVVGTGNGRLVHKSRFASNVTPRHFEAGMGSDVCANVTAIDFNPFVPTLFLVGLSDGSISLYKNDMGAPITAWSAECNGVALDEVKESMPQVAQIRWSKTRPSAFFVLDDSGRVHAWDLLENQNGPVFSDDLSSNPIDSIVSMDLCSCDVKGTSAKLLTGSAGGDIALHVLSGNYQAARENEADQLVAMCNFLSL
jgi:WD40 repeat protein